MSAIENPLSLLSFDQPESVKAYPIVPSYATANKIPVPLVDGITSSLSLDAVLPNSFRLTPPPSYRESSFSAGTDPGRNTQGLPIIHIINKQPLPRSQWVRTPETGNPVSDLKPLLSIGVNWQKIIIVLFIICLILFIIFIVGLLCKDSKRCNGATALGTSRSRSKMLAPQLETPKVETANTPAVSPHMSGFSRLLRPGPQVQASSLQREPKPLTEPETPSRGPILESVTESPEEEQTF